MYVYFGGWFQIQFLFLFKRIIAKLRFIIAGVICEGRKFLFKWRF